MEVLDIINIISKININVIGQAYLIELFNLIRNLTI